MQYTSKGVSTEKIKKVIGYVPFRLEESRDRKENVQFLKFCHCIGIT
jgi:hypothetical protein